MHVVIMGCGRVGSTLAMELTERGHSVAIIDIEPSAFRRLSPHFAGDRVTGMGFDRTVLANAGIERADAFAAVSSGDNSNIIAARTARENFGVQRVVARIYDAKRAEVYERVGIPTVATVRWTAQQAMRVLCPDDDREIWREPTGAVSIVEPPLHTSWVGSRLGALEEATGVRVAYLTRFGEAVLPTPSMAIQDGDRLFLLVTDDIADRVTEVTKSAVGARA